MGEEIKKVKKRYALDDAVSDLKKRQDLFNKSNTTISGLFKAINDNFTCMSITLPEDKKKQVGKEIAAVEVKLEVVGRFKETVAVIEKFVADLTAFDNSLKAIDGWKDAATAELKDIKEASGAMLPEDRVARTMDLQEGIASKSAVLAEAAATELALLPQGDKVDKDAQAFKNELNRITDYVTKLAADTKIECDKYSNDVKFWAEYRTGIKEYSPWLAGAEKAAAEGLSKPSDLNEVKALNEKVTTFDKTCLTYAKVLEAANGAAQKMTTHGEADAEVAALRVRTSSLWRRWNPPLESSRTSSRRRRSWLRVCNLRPSKIQFNQIGIQSNRSECCLRPNNLNLSTIPLVPLNIYVARFA